jgi:hypothetical protein
MTTTKRTLQRANLRLARLRWGSDLSRLAVEQLRSLSNEHQVSIAAGDLLLLNSTWYITNTGLLRLAARRRCRGIQVQPVPEFSDAATGRYAFKATVCKWHSQHGFVGHGDASPSNISPLFLGAEMRVAETRAVNRALRKAYGIGICSIEEIGSLYTQTRSDPKFKKTVHPANGNGNFGGRTVRDRLCQIIRHHQLDAAAVKSYATEFCGVKALRDATREQVEKFVAHLAEQADKDRSALVCQLNSYTNSKAGAA